MRCRACGSTDLEELFSLGEQRVSDFRVDWEAAPACEITLVSCNECTLVQQRTTAPQDFLFTRHYWYRSGVTRTMRDALTDIAKAGLSRVRLEAGDVVLDIGSNDGTLLRSYADSLVKVGVEPAINLKEEGSRGVDMFISDFWSYEAYVQRVPRQPRIVTAIGMFYDLEDPNKFIGDIAKVLHPEGLFIAQLMCAKQMFAKRDIGNLCHEHIEFYTLRSLQTMFVKHGLHIYDVEENDINGGSYRLYVRHLDSDSPSMDGDMQRRCHEAFFAESQLGSQDSWRLWHRSAMANLRKVVEFLQATKRLGKRTWIYGASTKGNMILQAAGIGPDLVDAAADKSQEKWGKFTSTGVPIGPEESMRTENPDFLLVLPYAFLHEFVERERAWMSGGGKFIVPLPDFHLYDGVGTAGS